MIPGMMGNQRFPTIKELWQNEKTKYRHWIILLGIGILAITAFSIASFIFNIVDKQTLVEAINANGIETFGNRWDSSRADNLFARQYIVFPTITIVALIIGVILYIWTIIISYKAKNFARLSPWPTWIIGFGAISAFISLLLILMGGGNSASFSTTSGIFDFTNKILFILIYILASSPVSRMRRTFLASERMDKWKNDPQFKHAQEQFTNMMQKGGFTSNNPFGMPPQNTNAATTSTNDKQSTNFAPADSNKQENNVSQEKINPNQKKLEAMTLVKLRQIGQKLSISGINNMKKSELIEAIIRITGNN